MDPKLSLSEHLQGRPQEPQQEQEHTLHDNSSPPHRIQMESFSHLSQNTSHEHTPEAVQHRDPIPLSRLDSPGHTKSSSSKDLCSLASELANSETVGSLVRNQGSRRRIINQDSNEPILFDELPSRSSTQVHRQSEDDDLERGVREITVAMEPEGSFSGLTTDEAITKLVDVATEVLSQYSTRTTSMQHFIKYITSFPPIATVVAMLCLLAFYIYGILNSSPRQSRLIGTIVEVAILAAIFVWNAYINQRDLQLRGREVKDRVKGVILELETIRLQAGQELKIPSIPSVSTVRVIRSGIVRTIPSNLIVKGDLIEMVYGDKAPCRVLCMLSRHRIEHPNSPLNSRSSHLNIHHYNHHSHSPHQDQDHGRHGTSPHVREFFLRRKEIFQPSLFGPSPSEALQRIHNELQGRYTFEVLETPLERILHTALDPTPRPKSLILKQLLVVNQIIFCKVLLGIALLAFAINLLRFILKEVLQLEHASNGFEQLLALPVYAALPLLPLSLPTLLQISKAYTNAAILVLFNTLQISKTEYEDEKDVDEFDVEAPPPTKNVNIEFNEVWKRFWRLLTRWDHSGSDFDDGLTRSTNLVESLGGITVICSIDKEGTIATAFPAMEQLFVATEDEDTAVLDVLEDNFSPNGLRFEDKDWETYIQSLKPIGLNQLLNTNCGTLSAPRRREPHRKCNTLHYHCRTRAAQQTCLCRLGKEIGFTKEALYPFTLQKEIMCFHPYLPMPPMTFGKLSTYEIPTMLSTIYHEETSDSYMVQTDGHVECVVECCTEYWNGADLQELNETMLKKISDFYQTAVVNDLQCVAYAYRPIAIDQRRKAAEFDPSTSEFITLPVRELPEAEEKQDEKQSSNNEYSPNQARDEKEEVVEATKTTSTDPEPLAESPRIDISSLPDPVNIVIEVGGVSDTGDDGAYHYGSSIDDSGVSGTKTETGPLQRWRKLREMELSGEENMDDLVPVAPVNTQGFYEEAVQGQIFLGMATLAHQPKTNVCDFIEDLGLAGIRFVYFSPASERESKAFADRLGLETDWNSCILLSSASDPFGASTGYLESYDIKAQLPRGIENIRPHLESVDDIPLHVSLFAECGAEAATEMIKIFQDYGEVVCCIGSSLNIDNIAAFAKADISVGMEPIRMGSSPESRSAFSLGAKINSLPCGLTMHSETSLYALTQVVREARRLLNSQRQGVIFMIASFMSISLLLLVSYCFLLPPAMTGYQILWLMWIIVPLLILSFFFSPHEPDTMTMMPSKNTSPLRDLPRFIFYFLARFILPIGMCVFVFLFTLQVYDGREGYHFLFNSFGIDTPWLEWSDSEQWALLYAQNFTMVIWVWYMIWMSSTFISRTLSMRSFMPWKNKVWIGACVSSLTLQFVFCIISLFHGPFSVRSVSWWVFVLAFLWPLVFLPVQEVVKARDMKECVRAQKLAKLEFNTKLGMHSPL
ncbi:hypothetical protein BC939DRAFT_427480 [Gamsiella multidivaricata]|uniref:uncharacterized protein n=1 Tax=Gamsiella multidivaricata TaxID=101098 RepID=UPI00221E8DC3|nr:uncharacterized protein BC939DRAFT_427480 [Gamsiella multidivaricata]KAI7818698.1 hypothetical protein BC939DRAFT_427480 [Gamsiella multidivaricata]